MLYNGKELQSINFNEQTEEITIIDQRQLPFKLVLEKINSSKEMVTAIKDMHLRGAPLIGVAAAYGMYLATLEAKINNSNKIIENAYRNLLSSRPTAINLEWALNTVKSQIDKENDIDVKIKVALKSANKIMNDDINSCLKIGENGFRIIKEIYNKKNDTVNILTHCNAGSLATVNYGTATAPIYLAKKNNIPIHVWVDETRPRNQGRLTSWELSQSNIDNSIVCDNTGGHLMQHNMVDLIIVGADRVAKNGDVANKIGTYLKALAAKDNSIPFYVAFPTSTIDWNLSQGKEIPIEQRDQNEVLYIDAKTDNTTQKVQLFANNSKAINYAFDITPAKLITGLITESYICKPDELKNKQ